MTKKYLQKLVLESFTKGVLDKDKVDKIANLLDRKGLKEYIKALKNFESKNSVIITLPSLPEKEDEDKLSLLFPNKKIVYNIDPSLMLGIKIQDNDLLSEFDLKNMLDDIVEYIPKKTYD